MLTSDHDLALDGRLTRIEKGVNALTTAMSLVIDTLQQQTILLAELSEAAKETPQDSPLVAAIDTLASAVATMGAGIEVLRTEMRALPDRLPVVLSGGAVGPSPSLVGRRAP